MALAASSFGAFAFMMGECTQGMQVDQPINDYKKMIYMDGKNYFRLLLCLQRRPSMSCVTSSEIKKKVSCSFWLHQ